MSRSARNPKRTLTRRERRSPSRRVVASLAQTQPPSFPILPTARRPRPVRTVTPHEDSGLPPAVFADRADAGRQLGRRLCDEPFHRPLVLAIPRGGIEVAAPLAERLHAELDIVLARKLRSPDQPELAIGAIGESGEVTLNHDAADAAHIDPRWLAVERTHQMHEIERRRALVRAVRPAASLTGRSVIVTDDGIATGSTMIAALTSVRNHHPLELIVAVPVVPRDRLDDLLPLCDRMLSLIIADDFRAVGQFYRRFDEVTDEQLVGLLRRGYEAWRRSSSPGEPV